MEPAMRMVVSILGGLTVGLVIFVVVLTVSVRWLWGAVDDLAQQIAQLRSDYRRDRAHYRALSHCDSVDEQSK